jgi:hypothetical protein
MGTRADFYVGTGPDAEWLGSIAWDGYRVDEMTQAHAKNTPDHAACWRIKSAKTEADFRAAVSDLLAINDDATRPEQGWPWPWDDSSITDYAYAFVKGKTKTFNDAPKNGWPDMSARKNFTLGKRSGVIVVSS